jgi:hypothetical protein
VCASLARMLVGIQDRCGETYPDMRWEPKTAFTAVADHYRR